MKIDQASIFDLVFKFNGLEICVKIGLALSSIWSLLCCDKNQSDEGGWVKEKKWKKCFG